MADKELRVRLEADDKLTPAAKKAADALDDIPAKKTVQVEAKGLKELGEAADALPGPLGEAADVMGKLGGAGVAGGIGAVAAGMFLAADAAADMAIEAQTTADLTGSTVEEASKLQSLWGRTGADVNDLNDVLLQMNGALAQSPELAKQLGVNLNDGKNISQRFVELTDKLASGQLTAVEASALFGEEGVRQVGKLRTMYGGLADDLENMPAPVDDEDVQQAIEMKNAIAELKATLSSTVGIVGKELVPLFGDMATLADTAADAIPGGKEGGGADALKFIREWGTGIGVIAKGAAALTTGGDDITVSVGNVTRGVQSASDALVVGYAPALIEAKEAQQDFTAVTEEGVDVAVAYAEALAGIADARRASVDSAFAARDADRDYIDQLIETETQLAEHPELVRENAAALDDLALAAGKNADAQAQLAVDQAAARGQTLSATEVEKARTTSLVNSARTTSGPMHDAIVNYMADLNGIPPEKVSEILADPNYATIDAAATALNAAAEDRDAEIRAEATNIGPTSTAIDLVASKKRTAYISVEMQAARNLVVPPGVTDQSVTAATATATGPATYAAPVGYAAPVIRVPAPAAVPITFNIGVMGNRFDSQRAVTKALRAHQRLNGRRE